MFQRKNMYEIPIVVICWYIINFETSPLWRKHVSQRNYDDYS